MKTFAPILVGVAVVGGTVFALLRLSSPSWVPVEESAEVSGAARGDGREAGLDSGSDSVREGGARLANGARRDGGSAGIAGAPRSGNGASGAAGGSLARAEGKGSAAVIAGQGPRAGGYVGQPVGGRAREGGGSSASIAERGFEASGGARERRGEVSDFLAQPPPGGGADEVVDGTGEDEASGEAGESGEEVVLSVPLTREHGTVAEDATPPLAEQDLTFADDGVGVKFTPDSVLAFPNAGNVKGDAGTMMLDIKPDWAGADEGDYSLVNVRTANDPRNLLRVFKNGKYLRYIYADSSGEEREVGYDMSDWEAGEDHSVAVSWGDAATTLYVDGQLIGQNTFSTPLEILPGTPMYLGSDVPEAGAKGAGGTISNFLVFGRALSPDEIGNPPTRK